MSHLVHPKMLKQLHEERIANRTRIAELETENTELRAALDVAANALRTIATVRNGVLQSLISDLTAAGAAYAGETKTFAIEAMRACWAALGKWP